VVFRPQVVALFELDSILFAQRLQLLDAVLLGVVFDFKVFPYFGEVFDFLLQRNDGFVSLVQTGSECDHDVALFEQQLLVAVDLDLFLLNDLLLLVQFIEFVFVLHLDEFGFFLQHDAELRGVLNFASADEEFGLHLLEFVVELLVLLLIDFVLLGTLLKQFDGLFAVVERLSLLLLE